jgi:hypothetical protein
LNIDVPDEDQQDGEQPTNSNESNCESSQNDSPSPNMPGSEGVFPSENTNGQVSYVPKEYSVNIPIFDIIGYIEQENSPSMNVTEWRVPRERKGRRSETPNDRYSDRVNPQDSIKTRPESRPRIALRGKDCPSDISGNPDDCPGQRTTDIPRDRSECDCCCHNSSSLGDNWFTEDSNSWGQADSHERSRSDSDRDDNDSDCDKKDERKDRDSDDNRESCDDNQSWDDDECDCTCDCRYPYGIAMYD